MREDGVRSEDLARKLLGRQALDVGVLKCGLFVGCGVGVGLGWLGQVVTATYRVVI